MTTLTPKSLMFDIKIEGFDGDDFQRGVYKAIESEMTKAARKHHCATHGRSPEAVVKFDQKKEDFYVEGMCCEKAVEDLVRSMK